MQLFPWNDVMYGRKLSARRETGRKSWRTFLPVFILTRDDQDVSVLVSVIRPVTSSAVADSEAGGLVTDQLEHQTRILGGDSGHTDLQK